VWPGAEHPATATRARRSSREGPPADDWPPRPEAPTAPCWSAVGEPPERSPVGASTPIVPNPYGDEPLDGVRVKHNFPDQWHPLGEAPRRNPGEDAHRRSRRRQSGRLHAGDGRHDEVSKLVAPQQARHRARLVAVEPSSDLARRLSARGRRVIHVGPPQKVPARPRGVTSTAGAIYCVAATVA